MQYGFKLSLVLQMNHEKNSRSKYVAIPAGAVAIDKPFIETHGYGTPGEYAVVCISDNGTGMDEETRSKIFEPFFTTKEVGKGTGLGLSIVYGIVKQHKGFIEVTSEPGKGTNFHVYLPLSLSEHPQEKGAPSLDDLHTGSETILVVEDEEHVRDLVQMVLKEFGYRVILAVDGQDALDKFLKHREDIGLIFTDLIMPKEGQGTAGCLKIKPFHGEGGGGFYPEALQGGTRRGMLTSLRKIINPAGRKKVSVYEFYVVLTPKTIVTSPSSPA